MCGKFTQMMSWRALHAHADFLRPPVDSDEPAVVTPMRFAQVLCLGGEGGRESVPMRWGFVDRQSRSPLEKPKHMHARAETIDTLPTFRDAFANCRGLVVVRDFNEGEEVTPVRTVQHTITPNDGMPLAIAVIYERWINDAGGELLTFCMVTTPANKLIGPITDRMPAIISPEHWALWLGETEAPLAQVKSLLTPMEADWRMEKVTKAKPPNRAKRPESQLRLL
jgi:putative SOS response-associated peptidase YedK